MKQFLLSFLLFSFYLGAGQNNPSISADLPTIIPPSPEVAQLTRIGQLSAGLHTGAANAHIPLYELSVGAIKLPIALSYSSNGIKVNEVPGRAGLGWNLVAGGVISRIIHDEEDGSSLTTYLPPPSFDLQGRNSALMNYLAQGNMEGYDTEFDEFSFSVNGLSGKFFIDASGGIHISSHSNVKIEKPGNYFILTDAGGVKYYFGNFNMVEKTRDFLINGTGRWNKIKTTAWFLTRIESLEGDVVNFNYNDIFIRTIQGPSQSAMLTKMGVGPVSQHEECNPICDPRWSEPSLNRVDYDTKYLSSISTSNGQQVYFIYEARPDSSNDNRLATLFVKTTNAAPEARIIRHYSFEYQDQNISGDMNQRFYLKKIYTNPTAYTSTTQTLLHQLDYIDPLGLPSQKSHGQDYFGYANGQGYNTNFFPRPINYQELARGVEGANRTPDFSYAVKGSLKRLTFPTGGFEEFAYEPHTLPRWQTDTVYTGHYHTLAGTGLSQRTTRTFTTSFTTGPSGKVKMLLNTYNTPAGPYPGDANYFTPDGVHELSQVEFIRTSDNQVVYSYVHRNYASQHLYADLAGNTGYTVKLTVWGSSVMADVPFSYVSALNTRWANDSVCGIRVRKIDSYDPVSNKANKKFYTYASLQDLSKSSGVGVGATHSAQFYPGGGICHLADIDGVIQIFCQNLVQVSSSSISAAFTFSGSPVAYAHVIESDDSLFANGGIEHQLATAYNNTLPVAVIGEIMPGTPGDIDPDLNGVEMGTIVFKKDGAAYVKLREVRNVYSTDSRVSHTVDNYVMRKKWEPLDSMDMYPDETRVLAYDVGRYSLRSLWFHLDTTITINYDQNGQNPLVQTVAYGYGNTVHTLPTSIKTWNSQNELLEQVNKYPPDLSGVPYTGMNAKHLIGLLVETSSLKGTSLLATSKVQFKDWSGTGDLYKPEIVKQQRGSGPEENRLRYHKYDAQGNPLEFSKEGDVLQSYVWGYDKTYPIAKAVNASASEIFFTSMEEGSGWDAGLSAYDDTRAHTGRRSGRIDPPSGTAASAHPTAWLQVNITTPTKFRYSGWIYSTAQNADIFLLARTNTNDYVNYHDHITTYETNKWVYLEKEFTIPAGVIQLILRVDNNGGGTVWFDDLRLHPSSAQMITYTYDPFIGMTSETDVNNRTTYYEYDGHNRLLLVRDKDGNILKQYGYKYGQPIVPCPNVAPNWQANGKLRCVVDASNNPTGVQEAQERDNNNCSPTYLQTRWVSLGQTGQCVPIPGCTGIDKRVVLVGTSLMCVPGTKVLVSTTAFGGTWYCTYRYEWSDGSQSPTFTETGTGPCMVDDY